MNETMEYETQRGKKEASKEALGEILHFREQHQIDNRCGAEQKY